jgi:hypothetical protein
MIMENRSKRLSEPLSWGRREKTVVAVLASCIAIVVIGLGVFALTSGSDSMEPKDCVDITFASTLGAAKMHACGARARTLCAAPNASKEIAQPLEKACRRAGYPFE